jgi:hypothetical protein
MNNMIFSYSGNPSLVVSKIPTKLIVKQEKKIRQSSNKEHANMLFSNNSSLHGSMFQRIQYVTSGCSACGK